MIRKGSTGKMKISANQMRAARGLLDWSQERLATAAGLSVPTIKRSERNLGAAVSDEATAAIQLALEKAGVIFVDENGEGPGVRLRKKAKRG
jgi:transcriptional regulator with XRE-family HTH domain